MNSLATIENSGTYQMLVNMGFPLQQSKSATKIYLNDIEAAVAYCSDHLSSPSSDENKQGVHFKKCYDFLQIAYPNYLYLFVSWFREEEFEDDQLIDEFIENIDYSESFFIQYVQDIAQENENIAFDNELAMRLFADLSDAISINTTKIVNKPVFKNALPSIGYAHIFEPILIDGYIREIRNLLKAEYKYKHKLFTEIPTQLGLLCHAYYPKFDQHVINIDMNLFQHSNLILCTASLYARECDTLFPSCTSQSQDYNYVYSIACLHLIGKDNNLPLLTYLFDAYNRYRIRMQQIGVQIVKQRFHHNRNKIKRYESTHKLIELSIKSFVNQTCVAFNKCPSSFKDICIQSMEYLTSFSGFSKTTTKCQSIYRIDDSLLDVTNYIFETYSFIYKYINTIGYASMPCQFDLVIIPNNVYDDDDQDKYYTDDNDDDDDQEKNVQLECNITQLLSDANVPFIHTVFGVNPNRDQIESSVNKLIGNKTNQRCCILIDRRNNENDEMFVYQTENKNDTINVTQFVNESLFDNSMNCLIPGLCGCKDTLNGYLFSLSFHIISRYEVRVYLNIDGFITRFFISDLKLYLPQFFKDNNVDYKSFEFKTKFKKTKKLLLDSKFDEFYKLILMDDSESPYS